MYKSEDGANSWRYILSGMIVSDIAANFRDDQIIYAAGIAGSSGKIIKSSDGGTTWIDVYNEPSKNNAVLTIAVATTNSAVLVAGLTNGEIIRSFDEGRTWQAIKDFSDRILRIRFSPSGSVYALTLHSGIQQSKDSGLNWENISSSLTQTGFSNSGSQVTTASAFYDFSYDRKQSGVLYLGTEEGLFRSVNDGGAWSFIKLPLKNASLRTSAVTVDPSNSNVIYAAVAATVLKSVNGGLTWETKVLPIAGSEVRSIIVNPQSANFIYLGVGNKR